MEVDKEKFTPENFVAACRSYIGTPFLHQGRSRKGLDCLGLVVCACADAGLIIPDPANYDRDPKANLLAHYFNKYCNPVLPRDLRPGDMVLMKQANRPRPHVGIIADKYKPHSMLHAPFKLAVCEVQFDPMPHVWRCYRYRGWF
jgi:cell wall-associated NlpC family hydrolase